MLLGDLEQVGKARFIVHCELGEHLAVKRQPLFFETTHQTAIGQPFSTCGGVDTRDPERPEVAFSAPAIAEGVNERMQQRLVGGPICAPAGATEALHGLEDLVALFESDYTAFNA